MKENIAKAFWRSLEVPYIGPVLAVCTHVACGLYGNPDWIGELD